MAASVLIRMGVALLVFVLMARGLGPAAFGLVTTIFAYATLGSLLTDFGFVSKTLRDIGADPANGGNVLNASLSVKLYLTIAVAAGGAVAIFFLPGDNVTRLSAGLLGLAILVGAIGDLALMAYRAIGRYSGETWLTVWTSTFHLVLVGWISLAHWGLLALAIAFVLSRTIYTALAIIGAERLFTGCRLRLQPIGTVWVSIRGAFGWAADSGLGYLTGQIDGLIVASAFGLQAAGIYQSGARFIQAALGLVTILASIHIPRMAREASISRHLTVNERRMMLEFTGVGVVMGLGFWLGGGLITKFLLGPAYKEVNVLWPGLAVFVAIRYAAASIGAALSARGMALSRVGGQIAALVVLGLGYLAFLPKAGLEALPWLMCAGAVTTLIANMTSRILVARGLLGKPTNMAVAMDDKI
ncbi:oligosaccharide flippase family protein [Caulobacter sp. BE254]|uniref:oligosaccharide flippase family protein n=1 Tax=Caulobacter sp. BE254 TaxID=2817720 RepID=UPI002865F17A|nr:oligosaccharide flippase family protein [Caulobacter sp. BE254]MDR7115039.1 O-antigen/teichoic acid export membrane protein [Caulobacter sp. BE254]